MCVNVEITEEEFKSKNPSVEPVRVVMTEEEKLIEEIKKAVDEFALHYSAANSSFIHMASLMMSDTNLKIQPEVETLVDLLVSTQKGITRFLESFTEAYKDEY